MEPTQDVHHLEIPVKKRGTCASCRWYSEPTIPNAPGICRAHPPVPTLHIMEPPELPRGLAAAVRASSWAMQTLSMWPAVVPDEFCSEWKEQTE